MLKACIEARVVGETQGTENDVLGIVYPEKVGVKDCLDDAGDPGDRIDISLEKVSVQPIRDVERSIKTQREQIMRGDGFGFSGPLEHEQLRKDRNRLQPDRKRPQDL